MKNESEVLAAQNKLLDLPKTGSIWRHFKGDLYVVIVTAIDEKTLKPVIIYRSIEYGHKWMRTYENWTELVEWPDGEMRHRFVDGTEAMKCYCRQCLRDCDEREPTTGIPIERTRMIVCPMCGNKRCPHAENHRYECTGSNEPGQTNQSGPK